MGLIEGIRFPCNRDGGVFIVDAPQEGPLSHVKFRAPPDDLTFCLKHKDGNKAFRGLHWIFRRVLMSGEEGQGTQADAVALFQDVGVMIAQAVADDVGDAGVAAAGGPHPENVMIAPLDVEVGMVEDFV